MKASGLVTRNVKPLVQFAVQEAVAIEQNLLLFCDSLLIVSDLSYYLSP